MADAQQQANELIERKIAELGDWRGELLATIRSVVKDTDPDIVEEVKWRKPSNPLGVAVWSHAGIVCTGETYKDKVKVTFPKGSAIADPDGVFNASLGGVRRAVDYFSPDDFDETAFRGVLLEAIAVNEG